MRANDKTRKPELLAPAGHVESFFAALENGADAIYLGLKQLSARASASNFSLSDLSRLLPYAGKRDVRIYVALNSLVTAGEIPGLLDLLQGLDDLQVDAVIAQDPAVFSLVHDHFPRVKIHASTLAAVHNHDGVRSLANLGVDRVVLARELTLDQIRQIASNTTTSLEVFVHGALCFSYSGLCLASSYRGGQSGLQGRCVQPCRLRFRQGRKQGYFFSCNDFSALSRIPQLLEIGLAAFKIEGRMKTADYIAQVVKAYRAVMDARPEEQDDAIEAAHQWVAQAPARRLTSGYLDDRSSEQVLAPHRSGSSGLWVGTVQDVQAKQASVKLRHDLRSGDRLRIESDEGKEKAAFTVSRLYSADGADTDYAAAGSTATLAKTPPLKAGQRLFLVGTKARPSHWTWDTIRGEVPSGRSYRRSFTELRPPAAAPEPPAPLSRRIKESLYLKLGRKHDLGAGFRSPAQWVILEASKANLEQVAKTKLHPAQKKRFVWSLPAIVSESDLDYYERAAKWFLGKGFRHWEVNNWSHFSLFDDRPPERYIAGCRLNVRNAAAIDTLARLRCSEVVLSLEITLQELKHLARESLNALPIVSVYNWPPLFVSQLNTGLPDDKPVQSPRGDIYYPRRQYGRTRVFPEHPTNWMEHLGAFRSLGYKHFLIDLSEGPRPQGDEMSRLLSGFKRSRADRPYSLFNLERKPVSVAKKNR